MGVAKNQFLYLILAFHTINVVYSANILFYFGSSPLSHRLAAWPLVTELSSRGHSMTFLSKYPKEVVSHPSVKEISSSSASKVYGDAFSKDPLELRQNRTHQIMWDVSPINALLFCEALLNDNDILKWLKTSKYDLVILDSLNNDCGLGLSYILKAKYIILTSSSLFMSHPDAFGFPAETSWIPDLQRHFSHDMNFFERFRNTIRAVRWHVFRESYVFPQHQKLFKMFLKDINILPFTELEKNVSLVLVNSHFSEEYARSLPPMVQSVGGMHILDSHEPLPKDLIDFIGNEEFIYMSLGSSISLKSLHKGLRDIFMQGLKKSGMKIIIKSDKSDFDKSLSPNIFVRNWLPQQAILAHPKIRGFISHGSSLSIQEAIYYSVPLIILPIVLDQDYNAERVEQRLGHAIRLEISELSEEDFHQAIHQLLNNSTIRENMRRVSRKFKDRPTKPLDLAVWWTEYVLRHEDTNSLKPLGINQSWFHRRSLDVWFLVFALISCAILGLAFYVKFVLFRFLSAFIEFFEKSVTENENKVKAE